MPVDIKSARCAGEVHRAAKLLLAKAGPPGELLRIKDDDAVVVPVRHVEGVADEQHTLWRLELTDARTISAVGRPCACKGYPVR